MNLRKYNIYFHTHTISGIIICALLFIMFFGGSYSFFKKEITAWQSNSSYSAYEKKPIAYQKVLDSLDRIYQLAGRDITFTFQEHTFDSYLNISPSKDSLLLASAKVGKAALPAGEGTFVNYNFIRKESKTYTQAYDMGEFLYRLHFFAPFNEIPIPIGTPFGYLLAGLVSFVFLFALITGLLLHWDKIVSNFFIFRPWSKVKTVWTDAHTALGVIGFPYQFIYAVTGIILIFNTAVIMPFAYLFYDGKTEKVFQELDYSDVREYDYTYQPLRKSVNVEAYITKTKKLWKEPFIKTITLKNYGDQSMHIIIEGAANKKVNFSGTGRIIYQVKDNLVVYHKSPIKDVTYIDRVKSLIYRLHFGDFGGYALKTAYFILGLMGCVVIISGILVWLVARDKNNIPAYKRKFNLWLANIFLAICLSMFPVTGLSLIAVKLNPASDQHFIYQFYFYSWLLLSSYYIIRKDYTRTNRETLFLGSLFSLLIPVVNGLYTGSWIWKTYQQGATDILIFDLFSLILGIAGMFAFIKIRGREKPIIPRKSQVS